MKYTINFEKEINLMLRNNIGLCPYFRNNGHRFSERFLDIECFYQKQVQSKYIHSFLTKNGMFYLRNLLKNEVAFDNPLFYMLFKAFVYAEIKFIYNFVPQNSHEERLTGHLVSEIANSLSIIKETFEQKAFELYHSNVILEFHYADLSANNNEKNTGADLGLIFHINLPDYQEKVNVAIIQSKKFNNNARIDLMQIDTLQKYAKNYAYYCFYDMNMDERNSPLIQKANTITSFINNDKRESSCGIKSLDRTDIVNGWDGGIPLSIFLIFDMLNSENENIKSFDSIWEAKSIIEGINDTNRNKSINTYNKVFKASRVLTVSVGGVSNSSQDLRDISKLFRFNEYSEHD
ncbi:MAG: hypothetical protein FWG98_10265 [Candidatus Cloacimonetes bacterium]|nr:hypothetical protein [Candidatus Cloacimonadota bacterium]